MKRPSFQFYPSDWLRDTGLRLCSTGARGLWIDMICFMHEGNPYGYLKVGDKVILPENLCRMVGEPLDVVEGWLNELQVAGVFDVDDGVICSRRMIRDEELRKKRAEAGKLGGNPALMDNHMVDKEDNQNPTPSSSSASSSSSSKNKKTTVVVAPEGVSIEVWKAFTEQRKKARAVVTDLVIDQIRKEASKINWTLEQAMIECVTRGWRGFKADWIKQPVNIADIARMTVPGTNERDPALVKLDQDKKLTAPPPPEILAKIKEVLSK
jgi:hypothetical protein